MRSKIITALVLLSLGIALTACSMSERAAAPAEPKPAPAAADSVRQPFGRILIAYFSRADTTQIQNPTAMDYLPVSIKSAGPSPRLRLKRLSAYPAMTWRMRRSKSMPGFLHYLNN